MPFGARSGGRVPAGRHLRQWGLAALAIGVVADAGQAEEPLGGQGASPTLASPAPASAASAAADPDNALPGTVSGSVTLTSNYVSRGITQTSNEPAVQGTLEYALETGVLGTSAYIGMFGSNAKLEGERDTSTSEIDALFGLRGEIGESGIAWDLGGAYYVYPGTKHADNFDYWEIPLILSYDATDWLGIEVFNAYTPEYQFNTGHANYTSGTLTFKIPAPYVALQVFGGLGYQYVEDAPSGTDWTAGITATVKGVDLTIAYTDTNYHARACGGNNQCDAKLVLSIGASF